MILSSCLSIREISSGISSSTSSSATSLGILKLGESIELLLSMDLSICLICNFDLCLINKFFFEKVNVKVHTDYIFFFFYFFFWRFFFFKIIISKKRVKIKINTECGIKTTRFIYDSQYEQGPKIQTHLSWARQREIYLKAKTL